MVKHILFVILTLIMLLKPCTTYSSPFFTPCAVTDTTSYVNCTSRQLSGAMKNATRTDVFINSTEDTKVYGYKLHVDEDSYLSLYSSFSDKTYWGWSVSLYSDAACINLVTGSGIDNKPESLSNQFTAPVKAGDYYAVVTLKYNDTAVKAALPKIKVNETVTDKNGTTSTVVKDTNVVDTNAKITDPNIVYNRAGKYYTVNNIFNLGAAAVPIEDCVSVKTSSINGIVTVVVDASKYIDNINVTGEPFIQYRLDPDEYYTQWTYDDHTIWNLVRTDWGKQGEDYKDIQHIPQSGDNKFPITTFYLKKTGWYSFRIAQPTADAKNYNAVIVRKYIDCTMPVVEGFKNNKIYNSSITIKCSDNSGDILYTKCDDVPFISGERVSAEGKHVIKVKDAAGNETVKTFYIDKKAPIITGVNNKVSYKTKRTVKIKDKGTYVTKLIIKYTNKKGKSTTTTYKRDSSTVPKSITFKNKGTYVISATDGSRHSKMITFKIK